MVRQRTVITLTTKQNIIKAKDSGKSLTELSKQFKLGKPTILGIIALRHKIFDTEIGPGTSYVTKKRSKAQQEMELQLIAWLKEHPTTPTTNEVLSKAKQMFEDLKLLHPTTSQFKGTLSQNYEV